MKKAKKYLTPQGRIIIALITLILSFGIFFFIWNRFTEAQFVIFILGWIVIFWILEIIISKRRNKNAETE